VNISSSSEAIESISTLPASGGPNLAFHTVVGALVPCLKAQGRERRVPLCALMGVKFETKTASCLYSTCSTVSAPLPVASASRAESNEPSNVEIGAIQGILRPESTSAPRPPSAPQRSDFRILPEASERVGTTANRFLGSRRTVWTCRTSS
jgi:hypothetical protein